jgi:hypothetical protein
LSFHSPTETSQASSGCYTTVGHPTATSNGSSLEVPSPTAYPHMRQRLEVARVCLARAACAFRFSQPLGAFIRPMLAGPVSCQIRSWGSPFRALLLSHRLSTVSGTRFPLAVRDAPESSRTPALSRAEARHQTSAIFGKTHGTPSTSGPYSVRESATSRQRVRLTRARGSLGLPPLQGTPPRWNGPAFTAPPLMRLGLRATNRPLAPSSGSYFHTRLAFLSRGCRPSWGLPPCDLHRRLGWT